MTTSREQFEAYALSQEGGLGRGHLIKGENGEYLNFAAQCYWDFWQASRAALVVELPELFEKRDVQGLDYDKTVAAIQSAGVGVRP